MSKVILTVEGSIDEIQPLLRYLSEYSISSTEEKAYIAEPEAREDIGAVWTEDKVLSVWNDVTPGCRGVLQAIAEKEEGVPWDDLTIGRSQSVNSTGGFMSSLGHQLRRHGFKKLPYPLTWVENINGYRLDLIWRQTILKIKKEIEVVLNDSK